MLVKTDSTPALAKKAIIRTIIALETAGTLDKRYSDEDKAFFSAQRAALTPKRDELSKVMSTLETYDEDDGLRLQTRVEVGDAVLDDGLGDSKAKTKAELRGQSGLSADHAFGPNLQKTQELPMQIETDEALKIAARMSDLPAFAGREAIQANLVALAQQQKQNLAERAAGELKRAALLSAVVSKTREGVLQLLSLKGLLDARFPEQKKRVDSFFLDIGRTPKAKTDPRLEAIVAVLSAHQITVGAEDAAKLNAETKPEVLEGWLQRAFTAKTSADLFV